MSLGILAILFGLALMVASRPNVVAARALLATLIMATPGCAAFGRVSSVAVDSAVLTNNAMVVMLQSMDGKLKAQRKALLTRCATQAPTRPDGESCIAGVVASYVDAFAWLVKAEGVQHSLADSLAAAQAGIALGESPSLSRALELYAELQATYAGLVASLARVK